MKRILLCAVVVAAGTFASAQEVTPDPAACQGLLSRSDRLGSVLSAVPRYGSTYVLVVPQRLAEKVPNATAPGVKDLSVAVQTGTAGGDVARAIGISNVREYPLSQPGQPLQDVKDGKVDAAILWAPLAGLAILELGMDAEVSVFTVDKPRAAPAAWRAAGTLDPCSAAIRDELDVSGVLPAELLVVVDIRDLLKTLHAPAFDLDKARAGAAVFNQVCSRCHGPDAVADPHGLAPVDLRISVTRFSYPAFQYIVFNGRPSKSMPPFRGTVTDEQVESIYQYLKARALKEIQ